MSNPAEWSANRTYNNGDEVQYQGLLYLAIASSKGAVPPNYPSYWSVQGGGGGGGGVVSITSVAPGIIQTGTATNVVLSNGGVVGLTAGTGINIAGPDASGTYIVTNTTTGTLTPGTGISITSGVIANTGVLSIAGVANSTSVTNTSGAYTIAASLSQPQKYTSGAFLGNINIPNSSTWTTIANVPVTVGALTMTAEFGGLSFSALDSFYGPNGGGNIYICMWANDLPYPTTISVPPSTANIVTFTFYVSDSTVIPLAINFLLKAGLNYTSSTTSFYVQAAIQNVSGSESATSAGYGGQWQLLGIN